MKKILLMCLLITTTAQITTAQISTVTGSVKDEKGGPIHFVFVENTQYNKATFTDSLGNFAVSAELGSKLKFELAGYKDISISVDKNNTNLQIVLRSLGAAGSNNSLDTKGANTGDSVLQRPNDVDLLSLPGHKKGNLRGNRYLFDNFAHGFIINSSDILIHDPAYLFDYDKLDGGLLMTKDKSSVEQISFDQTKSFTLYNNNDRIFVFEKVTAIDNSHYLQVLASGKKYKIYKLIKTKFVRADYVNNGVTSHGNDYDEYVDDADYYVWDVQGTQPQKLYLKKKSIKEDFAKEADKVNKFLSDNSGSIDDAYLSKLGAYMNQ